MSAIVKREAGRPTTFDPDVHIPKVHQIMSSGRRSFVQVAAELGIGRTTLWRWAKESPELEAELEVGKTKGESHLTDVLYKIGTGEMKGNPTAIAMILNNVYGWKSGNDGGNTYVQNNISLTYNQINDELQKYLDKMGVRNLKEFQENIIDVDPEQSAD